MIRALSFALVLALVLAVAAIRPTTAATTFVETFDGNPPGPTPFRSSGWEVTTHERGRQSWFELDSMDMHHGTDCGPFPASHRDTSYEGAAFLCRDHLMTAIHGGEYGLVSLTPNHLVDFSTGEAVIRFDISTHFTVLRDWWDVWVMPFEDNVSLPFDDGGVDLNGPPPRAVSFRMIQFYDGLLGPGFKAIVYKDNRAVDDYFVNGWTPYNRFIVPTSATARTPVEIRISRTHLKMCFVAYNFCYVDNAIPDLGWSQGVVKFAHHSYDPIKDGAPNTWHWDNISISPAVPFTLLKGDRRYVRAAESTSVTFPAPAPGGAWLSFSGIGSRIDLSFDGGQTWVAAQKQVFDPDVGGDLAGHFANYWTPVPVGVQTIRFRGVDWWGGFWMAKDFTIYARSGTSSPTATPSPTATATRTPTPVVATATATPAAIASQPTATVTPIVTASPTPLVTPTNGVTTVTPTAPVIIPSPTPVPDGTVCWVRYDANGSASGGATTLYYGAIRSGECRRT